MYKFFQIHNVSSKTQYIRSLDSNIASYVDISERLFWLHVTFPNYVDEIQNSSNNAGMRGLPKETAHALKFTSNSTYRCVKYLLSQVGFYYVLTRGAFFCSTEESPTVRSIVLLVAEDSLRASLFSAIKLDGRESRKVARLQRVNSATETTKTII
jgi:hypothetical protein